MAASEVRFAIEGMEPWLRDLGLTYSGSEEQAFGIVVGITKDVLIGRSPRDDVTKRGKAKSVEEHLQGSWEVELEDPWNASIFTDRPHAETLEEGKYLGVGPRTEAGEGGIFSRQAVGGIVGPFLEDDDIFEDAIAIATANINERFDKLVNQ